VKQARWIILLVVCALLGCAHSEDKSAAAVPVAEPVLESVEEVEIQEETLLAGAVEMGGAEAAGEVIPAAASQADQGTVGTAGSFSDEGEVIAAEYLDDDLSFLDEEDAQEQVVIVPDPLAPWNRLMFQFNDKFYYWFLKPVSHGYRAVVPMPVRTGVQNFFTNIGAPVRMGSCLVQGKGTEAQAEFARFAFNSTFGVFGLGNPAKNYPHLQTHDEDMGQALAVHGVEDGFYVVWPILGPSTARDTAGTVGDMFMNPISYLPLAASAGATGEKNLNSASDRIGDYETLTEAAVDPYEAVRDAYLQNRKAKIEE
jgi:phospholipid-binding lipoprotein MlaA